MGLFTEALIGMTLARGETEIGATGRGVNSRSFLQEIRKSFRHISEKANQGTVTLKLFFTKNVI